MHFLGNFLIEKNLQKFYGFQRNIFFKRNVLYNPRSLHRILQEDRSIEAFALEKVYNRTFQNIIEIIFY